MHNGTKQVWERTKMACECDHSSSIHHQGKGKCENQRRGDGFYCNCTKYKKRIKFIDKGIKLQD